MFKLREVDILPNPESFNGYGFLIWTSRAKNLNFWIIAIVNYMMTNND